MHQYYHWFPSFVGHSDMYHCLDNKILAIFIDVYDFYECMLHEKFIIIRRFINSREFFDNLEYTITSNLMICAYNFYWLETSIIEVCSLSLKIFATFVFIGFIPRERKTSSYWYSIYSTVQVFMLLYLDDFCRATFN